VSWRGLTELNQHGVPVGAGPLAQWVADQPGRNIQLIQDIDLT